MFANDKMTKQIVEGIKGNTGRFRVDGQTCNGSRWPEGEHFWVIDDLEEQKTHHVAVDNLTAQENKLLESLYQELD